MVYRASLVAFLWLAVVNQALSGVISSNGRSGQNYQILCSLKDGSTVRLTPLDQFHRQKQQGYSWRAVEFVYLPVDGVDETSITDLTCLLPRDVSEPIFSNQCLEVGGDSIFETFAFQGSFYALIDSRENAGKRTWYKTAISNCRVTIVR